MDPSCSSRWTWAGLSERSADIIGTFCISCFLMRHMYIDFLLYVPYGERLDDWVFSLGVECDFVAFTASVQRCEYLVKRREDRGAAASGQWFAVLKSQSSSPTK